MVRGSTAKITFLGDTDFMIVLSSLSFISAQSVSEKHSSFAKDF